MGGWSQKSSPAHCSCGELRSSLLILGTRTTAGRRTILEQRRCSDSDGGSSGSATAIIVQRQCRNTARAEGTNHGHSSAERALCNCTVDFDWQPERSKGFCNRIKDFGFREGLRQHPKQPLTFAQSLCRFGPTNEACTSRGQSSVDLLAAELETMELTSFGD